MSNLKDVVVEFDYNKEALENLKNEVLSVDMSDKEEIKKAVKVVVKARGIIQKKGKSYRDEANAFNKAVLSKEKEYLEIIGPAEEKLKYTLGAIEEEELLEARRELLPMKLKQMEILKTIDQPTEEFLLSLDAEAWVEYYNSQMKLEQENLEREEARKKDIAEAEERAKKQAEENLEKEKARLEQEKKDAVEKVKRDAEKKEADRLRVEAEEKAKVEKEEQEKAIEKARLEADKKFQDFLEENKYNPDTDKRVKLEDGSVGLYRLVAIFKK